MKKRSLSRFFMSVLAMCTIAACNNDELDNKPDEIPNASKDAVYMNVQVQLPVAGGRSRSNTDTGGSADYGSSSNGTEVGKSYENMVKKVLLVLAEKNDNNIIAYGLSSGADLSQVNSIVTATHKIKKAEFAQYYADNGVEGTLTDNEINVYVFCNPTNRLINVIDEATDGSWIDSTAKITEIPTGVKPVATEDGAAIWGGKKYDDGFLMSTASKTDIGKKLPKKIDLWDQHTDSKKPFHLSGNNSYDDSDDNVENNKTIRVERSVARFDFKDGSSSGTPYTYNAVQDDDNQTIIQIRLEKMGLVNMSKEFYYLRRVSDNGLNTNKTLCGTETSTNYVVDTDAAAKQGKMENFTFGNHFNFCLGHGTTGADWTIDAAARGQWYTTSTDITSKDEDTDDPNWSAGDAGKEDYHIWRYVTENTIPVPTTGNVAQRHGISTGIVFRGKMIATDKTKDPLKSVLNGSSINGIPETDPILYAYGDHLFVRWTEVRDYAIENKDKDRAFYNIVFGTPTDGVVPSKGTKEGDEYKDATYSNDETSLDYLWDKWFNGGKDSDNLLTFKQAVTTAQFTLYQSSKENDVKGYYCYYYYWNRHNDNGKNGDMGPMEFAVVRNNVYKLAVTNIKRLGHPRISENDPDPENPENPDENSDVYLDLSVQVLPWVVRVNDIEF